jgi:putative ABC transport system substrate-binding protein
LLDATHTVPVVFTNVVDPVGAGLVASLARPSGNVTGFMTIEYGIAGKLLELLTQVAPSVTRAAVLRDPTNSALIGQFAAVQGAAPSLRIEVTRSTYATLVSWSVLSQCSREDRLTAWWCLVGLPRMHAGI